MTRTKKRPHSHFVAAGLGLALSTLGLNALLRAAAADAQQQEPVLHEFFTYSPGSVQGSPSDLPALPEPGREDASAETDTSSVIVQTAQGPSLSDALRPPWQEAPPQLPDQWNDPVGMDLNTTAPDLLQYIEAFEPSVAPFKRLGVRNRVIGTAAWGEFALAVPSSGASPVTVSSRIPDGYDLFTGTVAIETDGAQMIPVPSVSPDEMVLQARTIPDAGVQWLRDEAGNAFVWIDSPGLYTLHWLVAVDPAYFSAPLDRATLPRQAPAQAPGIRTAALQVLAAAGTSESAADHEIVERLTRWLQGFTATDVPLDPQPGQSEFLSVALSEAGVCRHRALIFVVVLQAIGVRAQYVYNEAHAFVEVNLSGRWRRIDLGGAAGDVQLVGDPETEMYDSPPDSLAPSEQPVDDTSFGPPRNAQTSGETDANADADPNAAPSNDGNGAANGASATASAATDGSSQGGRNAPTPPNNPTAANADNAAHVDPTAAANAGTTQDSTVSPDGRPYASLQLIDVPLSVYRGDTFAVSASLTTPNGEPVAERTLTFILQADRSGANEAPLRLGTCTTDAEGICTIALQVPAQVRAGTAELGVEFGGDDQWAGTSTLIRP
jgi:hypothetical protein